MPGTPITTNLDEAPNVKIYPFPKLTLNPILPVNKLTETVDLVFGKAIRVNVMNNASSIQNPPAQGRTDTIDIL